MTPTGPQVVVLSFQGGDLVGGGQVYRVSTPGGTTFLVTAPRGRTPDLDGVFDDPTPVGIERVLRRNDALQWLRIERDGRHHWHPQDSDARVVLSDLAYVVCYGTRKVPGWLSELAGSAHTEVVLRLCTAAGLEVSAASLTHESALQAGSSDGSAWTPGRHLGTGLQGLWAWSTASWRRAAIAAGAFALAVWVSTATVTVFSPAPLTTAPSVGDGVILPGSGMPALELDPCEVLRGGGRPAVAAFCDQHVGAGSVDPDLWHIAGNTAREVRADLQSLNMLSGRTADHVHAAWSPVLSALFGKVLLVEYMPPEWGVDHVQSDSPYLGPTRAMGESDADFDQRFPSLLAQSPQWKALWSDGGTAPAPEDLHRELFDRSRTLAAHGELLATARR